MSYDDEDAMPRWAGSGIARSKRRQVHRAQLWSGSRR